MKKTLIVNSLILGSVVALQAATTITYDFSNGGNSSVSGSDATANTATWGAFIDGVATSKAFSTSTHTAYTISNATKATTLPEAITKKNYLTMTITAGSQDIKINSIEWDHQLENRDPNSTPDTTFNLSLLAESSGFAATDALKTTSGQTTGPPYTNHHESISLGTILQAGQTEEFRFYFSDNANEGQTLQRLDNIVITVTAVPEPSSAALLALGGLALILRRRK